MMVRFGTTAVFLLVCLLLFTALCFAKKPHIVLIVADDLGWNDVGWVNPDMQTPNLDYMANNGVLLNYSYVSAMCSPSRAAMLSGYYPFHLGLQVGAVSTSRAKGLPSKFTLLPEKLKGLGYSTHMVGKWHLGFCNWSYTPTRRGFDSFVGFYTGSEDYYTHIHKNAYDLRFNEDVYKTTYTENKYSTELFSERAVDIIEDHDPNDPLFLYLAFNAPHSPLQVPQSYIDRYENVTDLSEERKIASGMITALDDAIGNVKQALTDHGFMDNTIIIFTSDNGGQPHGGGNNYPLRGTKGTYWEGGTRVPAFVYSIVITEAPYVSPELFHATDWFPTILSMAGGQPSDWEGIDGVDQWHAIRFANSSVRNSLIYNIDYTVFGYAAIRNKEFKLVFGDMSPESNNDDVVTVADSRRKKRDLSGHTYGDDEAISPENARVRRQLGRDFKLYKIDTDISEDENVIRSYRREAVKLREELYMYNEVAPQIVDPTGGPDESGVWSPGWCPTDTLYT